MNNWWTNGFWLVDQFENAFPRGLKPAVILLDLCTG